jgi:hypothetical protein
VVGDGEAQEAWCDHREELDRTQVDELEPRIGLVDMVDDQCRLLQIVANRR